MELPQPYSLPMGLSSIPSEQPVQSIARQVQPLPEVDVMEETSRAYRLADQVDAGNKKKQAREDEQLISEALKQGADIQTPEGVLELAQQLKGKVSPTTYENLLRTNKELKAGIADSQIKMMKMDDAKLNAAKDQSEFVVKELSDLVSDYDKNVEEKGLDVALDEFSKKKEAKIAALSKMGTLPEKSIEQFKDMSPGEVMAKIKASTYYQNVIKQTEEIKRIQAQTKLTETKQKTEEAGGLAAVAYRNAVEEFGENSPQAKAALNKMSGLGSAGGVPLETTMSADAIDMAARRILKGDKTALQNIGRGAQGAANITAINNRVAEIGKETGKTAEDILKAQSELGAVQKGLKDLAGRQSKLDAVALEVDSFADNALKSLDKVTRSGVVPLNKIIRSVAAGTGSPEEAEFATYVQSLVGAYATAINRGGAPSVYSQEKAAKIINSDYTPEQFKAMVNALKVEVQGVIQSSKDAAEHIKGDTFKKSETDNKKVSSSDQQSRDVESGVMLVREAGGLNAAKDQLKGYDEALKNKSSMKGDAWAMLKSERDRLALGIAETEKSSGQTKTPKQAPEPKNSKGWILHKDAQGNMAYVGPKGEIEEVK